MFGWVSSAIQRLGDLDILHWKVGSVAGSPGGYNAYGCVEGLTASSCMDGSFVAWADRDCCSGAFHFVGLANGSLGSLEL